MGTVLLSGLHARSAVQLAVKGEERDDTVILAINYKAYPTAFGTQGLAIALAADRVAEEYGPALTLILAVPATEIARIVEATDKVKVYGQHADPIEPGPHTGYLPLEALKEAGAKGTLVNHSEHRVTLTAIDKIIQKAATQSLETLACADTPTAAAAIAALSPTILAIEPPELIGTGIPVSKAKPEIITRTLKLVEMINPDLPILTGAGITRGEDAAAAIKLGTKGVLVASTIMKAKDPEQRIRELAEAMTKQKEKQD